jgi:hypothetical protein
VLEVWFTLLGQGKEDYLFPLKILRIVKYPAKGESEMNEKTESAGLVFVFPRISGAGGYKIMAGDRFQGLEICGFLEQEEANGVTRRINAAAERFANTRVREALEEAIGISKRFGDRRIAVEILRLKEKFQ